MTVIDDLLGQIPLDRLAGQLGVDERTAEQATRQALPALLAGMQANAQDPAGSRSLAEAVGQHDGGLLDGGVDVDRVDTADGEKIVGHVFGDNQAQVVNQLGDGGGAGSALMGKLLPLLAPIVMAYLAKRLTGAGTSPGTSTGPAAGASGGGGLGDLLGGLLGGGGQGSGQGSGQGGGLGDLLGGLLGQGRR